MHPQHISSIRKRVTGITFAFITFVCTLTSALLGTALRTALPPTHVSKESQDVVRLGMGLVATMTALLLGLVTAAAKGSFDSQDTMVKNTAAATVSLDRLLARYGPETQPTRELLRRTVALRVDAIFPTDDRMPDAIASIQGEDAAPAAEKIEDQILNLRAETDVQRWIKSESLKLTEEVLRNRWRVLGGSSLVQRTFLVVVIFWLSMTFGSFGLSAPRNATVITVFVISALSVAAAVMLILELDGPFDGFVRISGEPFRRALMVLGH